MRPYTHVCGKRQLSNEHASRLVSVSAYHMQYQDEAIPSTSNQLKDDPMTTNAFRCSLLLITIGSIVAHVTMFARPSFIPTDAYWRIDRYNGTPDSARGKWEEVGRYPGEDGDWGQGQCVSGGSECHLYDFVTWWEVGASIPGPGNGYTTILWGSTSFPCCYDSVYGYTF